MRPEWLLGGVGSAIALAAVCSWELVAVGFIAIEAGGLVNDYVTGNAIDGEADAVLLASLGLALGLLAWLQWGIWRPRTRHISVPGPARIMAELPYPSTHPLYALLELLAGVGFLALQLDTVAGMDPMPSYYEGDLARTLEHAADFLGGMTVALTGLSIYLLMAATRLLAWYAFHRRPAKEDTRTARVAVGVILGVVAAFAASVALLRPA